MEDFIRDYLREKKAFFEQISQFIFSHPETRFEEYESASFLAEACEKQGFEVEKGVGNIATAFVATYGKGAPIIGFLGEYDALSGLSQTPNQTTYQPLETDIGHGCGHNLLGTGAFAAACAVKEYLDKHSLPGTVKFFGCPGEEGGSGKTFMVREGVFTDVDAALTWHPSPVNAIMSASSLANYQISFAFKGTTSHAANSPHLGRSALDAVELMNVGVNYLREHVVPEARLHYATTNTGGISPNVVQANAEVLYLIRAPKVKQVEDMYQRVCKIAQGAALMTETELTIRFDKACSNYIPNRSMENMLHDQLSKSDVEKPTEEEKLFAEDIWHSLTDSEREGYLEIIEGFGYVGNGEEFTNKYLAETISPYEASDKILSGSTDVADVSWVVPTAQLTAATSTLGTPLHSWQMTAQGISSFAHKGMLRAAQAMAMTGIQLMTDSVALKEVKEEFQQFTGSNPYTCPIPKEIQPSVLKE
ncbi:amidohydrolase [Virgibacillus dokdonensis]|uniref:Amidohydrolase n=1 Tax=Virgibacillus dokdonensis TaxID=302167 RepID=A0A3E0WM34_9BACI|nr:M20 family metallopeptidase [Virgibacillus dokdonensis]RFA34024.1 amidohydrolase [Virgibacillus dokdonensis]